MKKLASIFLTLVLALSCTFVLAACGDPCKDGHTGGTATCTQKAVCEVCEKEYGELLAHTGGTATCQVKAKCTVCNQEYGELAAHTGGTATCQEKATCSVCNNKYGELGYHDYTVAANRILIWRGDGENILVTSICKYCDTISPPGQSLGNYRTISALMNPPDHPNAIKEFYKLIFDYADNDAVFSIMQADKRLEIGTETDARTCTIDDSKSNPADIKGEITVVNGNLILKGNVKMSGKIIVKSGATLTIETGAEVANSGAITVEKGGILVNNGTVTGTDIVNNNN